MAEVLFYHLQHQPLERVLPMLLVKTLERGWRAVVETSGPERLAVLDDVLWTYSDESFLPHAAEGEADAADPIVLTQGAANPNGAQVRFLVDGAGMPADAAAYERIVYLFDGHDDEALERARGTWREVKAAGHAATYWQQDEAGRWQKRG